MVGVLGTRDYPVECGDGGGGLGSVLPPLFLGLGSFLLLLGG